MTLEPSRSGAVLRADRRAGGGEDPGGRAGWPPAAAGVAGTGDRTRPLGLWIRGSIGMLGTIPLMLMDLADPLIPTRSGIRRTWFV